MKKLVVIMGFVALMFLVLTLVEDETEKLLKKQKLTDTDKEKLKKLKLRIDEKLKDTESKAVEPEVIDEPVKVKKEDPVQPVKEEKTEVVEIQEVKNEYVQPENEKSPVTEKGTENKLEQTVESKEKLSPSKQTKPCRKCGMPMPKYPINEVYCPKCKAEIKAQKENKKVVESVNKNT